jgi:hypothetical protein
MSRKKIKKKSYKLSEIFSYQPHISELITGYLGIYSGVARLVCKEWAKNIPIVYGPYLRDIFTKAAKDGKNKLMKECYNKWGLKIECEEILSSGNQGPIAYGNILFCDVTFATAVSGHLHTLKLCEKLWPASCSYDAMCGAASRNHVEIMKYCLKLRRKRVGIERHQDNYYDYDILLGLSRGFTDDERNFHMNSAMVDSAGFGDAKTMVKYHDILGADAIDGALCAACFYQNPECARICHEEWGGSDTIYNTYLEEQREYWSANHQDKNVNDFFLV